MLKTKLWFPVIVLLLSLVFGASASLAQSESKANLILEPAQVEGKPGSTFELMVKAVPGNRKPVSLDVFLDFDPLFLEVEDSLPDVAGVQIKPAAEIEVLFRNNVDNAAGNINFGAGWQVTAEQSATAPFAVASITFKIKAEATGSTAIRFHTGDPRRTAVGNAEGTAPAITEGAAVLAARLAMPVSPPATQTMKPSPKPAAKPAVSAASKSASSPVEYSAPQNIFDRLYEVSEKVKHFPWWVWLFIGLIIAVGIVRMIVRMLIQRGRLKEDE